MASGGFFSSLNGDIRFTDSLINGPGPLPTDLRGGPQGVYGQADGIYNGTSQLLENIVPYSQPGQGNLNANKGPQTAHRIAAGIPRVELPDPDPEAVTTFSLFHSVDNGDIAFIVTPVSTRKYVWLSAKPYPMQSQKHLNSLTNVNVFLNVVQVNYVLAGIFNRLVYMVGMNIMKLENDNAWDSIITSFGKYAIDFSENIVNCCAEGKVVVGVKRKSNEPMKPMKDPRLFLLKTKALLQHIIKFHIKPFGICAGSEKQGGQHEGRDKPVQAAASYFTTLTVDGQNRDLVNIWRNNEIEGGDQLIMHLAPVKRSPTVLYTLNHYSHGTVSKYMTFNWLGGCVLQMIPTFFKVGELPEAYRNEQDLILKSIVDTGRSKDNDILKQEDKKILETAFDYRVAGYWHCGQTYTKSARYGHVLAPFSDHEYMTGALMQVNWAPVWKGGASLEWLTKDVVDLANTYLRNLPLLSNDNADVMLLQTKMNAEYCKKRNLSENFELELPETHLINNDEFDLITYLHVKDDGKSNDNVGAVRVAACKIFLESRMKSEARSSSPVDWSRVVEVAPMQTLVPQPVTRAPARTTTPPAARASTLELGGLAMGAAAGAAGAAGAEPAAKAAAGAELATGAATGAAVPEPKKKRVVLPKAVQLPTASPEELELERLFAGRGAGAGQ
jgi:hypothetical protein